MEREIRLCVIWTLGWKLRSNVQHKSKNLQLRIGIFIYHRRVQVGTIKLLIRPADRARAASEPSKNGYLRSALWRVSYVLSGL